MAPVGVIVAALTPESEVILRQAEFFVNKTVLFAGALGDALPDRMLCKQSYVHTAYFDYYCRLKERLASRIEYGVIPSADLVAQCDCLIYYWPKNKLEAEFQLKSILSQLPLGIPCYIIGENRSGVRSVEKIFQAQGAINKIDIARRCSLYFLDYRHVVDFDIAQWWRYYQVDAQKIAAMPGVFSADRLDEGTKLLLSILKQQIPTTYQGAILDIGCGSGVLGCQLLQHAPQLQLTMSDIHAGAIASSEKTLELNHQQAQVIPSHLFSEINGVFDIIISNPPFHTGRQVSLSIAEKLFMESLQHLKPNGVLYIVANAFLPYAEYLQHYFGKFEVLANNHQFKVYRVTKSTSRRV